MPNPVSGEEQEEDSKICFFFVTKTLYEKGKGALCDNDQIASRREGFRCQVSTQLKRRNYKLRPLFFFFFLF